jgi:hypothetical protein
MSVNTTGGTMTTERKIYQRIPSRPDIEIHVYSRTVEGQIYFDVREYVISKDEYGRGITFRAEQFDPIWTGLEAAWKDLP